MLGEQRIATRFVNGLMLKRVFTLSDDDPQSQAATMLRASA